jgi:hypothetical protein
MNSWFGEIRLQDACVVGGVIYRVHARAACLQPDSSSWRELLLVPNGETPRAAIDARTARWLAWKPDIGGMLWTPIEVPDGVVPDELDALQRLEFRGRVYRRQACDHFQISQVEGETGSDVHVGERIQFVEMLAGAERPCLERSTRGLEACTGHRMTAVEIRDAFLRDELRPDPLEADRRRSFWDPSRPRPDEFPSRLGGWFRREVISAAIAAAIAIPLVLLYSCSRDCQQTRVNPQTGRTEYVCADGSVRSSRSWFDR